MRMKYTPAALAFGLSLQTFFISALPQQEAQTAPEIRCGLGGITPNTPWPGTLNPGSYAPGKPKVCKVPAGTTALRLKDNTSGYEQFLFITENKISAVIREYDESQEPKILEALKARYGEPANPNIETGSMGLVLGKQQTRKVWLDQTCMTRIEFIRQESAFFKGKLNRSTKLAVIVTAVSGQKPGDSPNPLN